MIKENGMMVIETIWFIHGFNCFGVILAEDEITKTKKLILGLEMVVMKKQI